MGQFGWRREPREFYTEPEPKKKPKQSRYIKYKTLNALFKI